MGVYGRKRLAAARYGEKTFDGNKHQCGRTLRYTSSGSCVWCLREKNHNKLKPGERKIRLDPQPIAEPPASGCVRPFKNGALPSHMILADGKPRRLEFLDDGRGRLVGDAGGESWTHALTIDVTSVDGEAGFVSISICLHGVRELLRLNEDQARDLAYQILKGVGSGSARPRVRSEVSLTRT